MIQQKKIASLICIIIVLITILGIPVAGCSTNSDNTTGIRESIVIPDFELPSPPVVQTTPVVPIPPPSCSQIGCKAPDFSLESISGKSISLADYKGKNLLLCFWLNGSQESEEQLFTIEQVYGQWPQTAMEFLVINSKGDRMNVKSLLMSKGLTVPVVLDKDGKVNELYKNTQAPVTYLIDGSGIILRIQYGLFKDISELDKFLGSKPCGEVGNKVGNQAPDFTLKDANDVALSLNSLRGRKVAIIFLQTACETCRAQMKFLQEAIAIKSDKDWVAILIAIRDSRDYVKRITQLYSITLPILLDSNGEVNDRLYKPAHLPYTFFINENGCIRYTKDGYYENYKQVLSYMDF